jgi:hypothetical protein
MSYYMAPLVWPYTEAALWEQRRRAINVVRTTRYIDVLLFQYALLATCTLLSTTRDAESEQYFDS